ncbi:GMC family oxidoreductase [Mucilaginibacter sp.]|jgi:choline dehydrogenase-like flavoprotein|uniref:GMC family oxidoreductase n=1 Tax=Mucilaginibacter sp. TaxID=1882438 RepID=UPI00356927A1
MSKVYDYIIVGSGVAGITIAKRLLEADPLTSILILEAGPEIPAKNRRFWWDYITLGKTPYDFTYDKPGQAPGNLGNINFISEGARVKAYGGSTMHWGAWALRFKPEDFQLYTNTGKGADWPISYDELEPYYNQAEEYLSVCGDDTENWAPRSKPYPMPAFQWTAADGVMIKAFRKLGIMPGKMPVARYRKCFTTGTCKYCPFGSRFSAQYVLDELRANKRYTNFEVRTSCVVTQVHTSGKNKVESIDVTDNRDKTQTEKYRLQAGRFIICSGAYETPKLLMKSKNEFWKNGIGNDHDHLGRYLISHSMLKVRGRFPTNKERWFQEYDFPTLMSRSYDTPADQDIGKVFLFKNRVLPNMDIAQLMIDGNTPEQIEAVLSGPMELELQAFMEEKGHFDNRLEIMDGEPDEFGLPLTKITFSRTPEEMVNTGIRLKQMEKVIEAMGYAIVYSKTEDPGGHHTTGTCRMGKTAADGVTDLHMKVFGTDNLYLCSNGVFPTGSAVNPTLTLTALSMRLADHLIANQKS